MIHPTSQSLGSNRTGSLPPASGHATPPKKIEPAQTGPASESLSTAHAESLHRALASSPEIRPEMVELGRKLAVDPNYPPLEIIEQLSELFVNSVDPSESV